MSDKRLYTLWVYIGCMLFYGAIFAGNFDLCRLYTLAKTDIACTQPILLRHLLIFPLMLWVFYEQLFQRKLPFFSGLSSPVRRTSLIAAGLFSASVGISLVLNTHVIQAGNIFALGSEFVFMAALIVLLLIAFRDSAMLKQFLVTCIAISVLMVPAAYMRIGYDPSYGPGFSAFGSPLSFYKLQLMTFLISLHMALQERSMKSRAVFLAAAFFIGLSVLTTYSKAAFLIFNLCAVYICGVMIWRRQKKALRTTVLLILVINTLFLTFFSSTLMTRVRTVLLLANPQILAQEASSLRDTPVCDLTFREKCYVDRSHRIPLIKEALTWHDGGLFFGKGYGEFKLERKNPYRHYNGKKYIQYTYPHNILLDILYAFGIIPLALFAVMSLALFRELCFGSSYLLSLLPVTLFLGAQFAGDIIEMRALFIVFVIVKLYQKLVLPPAPYGQVL